MDQDQTTGPINIGNPAEISVRELAEMVIKACGTSSTIVEEPLPKDDPKRRRPDISRAQEVLRWSPEVSLEEGLEKTIGYFRKLLGK